MEAGRMEFSSSSSSPSPSSYHGARSSSSHYSDYLSTATTPPPAITSAGLMVSATKPRSSSLAANMGQTFSRATPPPVTGSTSSQIASKVAGTGFRLKRAFAGRRKKSEDIHGPGRDIQDSADQQPPPSPASTKSSNSARQITLQILRGGKSSKQVPSPQTTVPPTPPPKPPKPVALQAVQPNVLPARATRASVMTVSPGMASALDYMRRSEEEERSPTIQESPPAPEETEPESQGEQPAASTSKEAWRKSDSTISHHTIRPGAPIGSRTPRPVSMADSFQSSHTIVPINKRLSALVGDADFGMLEEDVSVSSDGQESTSPGSPSTSRFPKSSPASSLRLKNNRRSASLNLGPTTYSKPTTALTTSVTEPRFPLKTLADSASTSRETPTLTKADASGIISPSSAGVQSTGTNIRGRLAAWSATASGSYAPPSSGARDRHLPALPPIHPNRNANPTPVTPLTAVPPLSLRQTAVSMTAPAAGLAKRAVEKMGRAWGGISSASSNSGYSSSSSSNPPSSYSSAGHDQIFARAGANQSSPGFFSGSPNKGRLRRTPDASSGTWSLSSSATSSSVSDNDQFSQTVGPSLGIRLRGPLRTHNSGGMVFGKDLRTCVKETPVERGRAPWQNSKFLDNREDLKQIEQRALPALVIRCFQHLMIWGIQEEGLFRVSGRPSHVSKLRIEFDTGADFDMSACTPGDLDPHAVASVFKAYLRELPEPILTHALLPRFEAAMNAESAVNQDAAPKARGGARGPTLPSGPRNGLPMIRKPPSLSTLAMPSFTGMPRPSASLVQEFASIISQLPEENRDLIRTVTEIINATAKERQTKMPLSNLLLVFCPSLSMNPPLLRVLCEGDGIWLTPVMDIRRESVVLDISASPSTSTDGNRARPVIRRVPPPKVNPEDESNTDGNGGGEPTARPAAVNFDLSSQLSLHDSLSQSSMSDQSSEDVTFESRQEKTPSLLSSSLDSISTPSTSSHSLSQEHHHDAHVVEPNTGFLPTGSIPSSHGTIEFPSTGSAPPTPLIRKRSLALLSMPNFSSLSSSNNVSPTSSTSSPRSKRLKRPSLNLLFSKRNGSPHPSISAPSPHVRRRSVSESDSSNNSTPASAVTAPYGSVYKLPPVPVVSPSWDLSAPTSNNVTSSSPSAISSPPAGGTTGPTPISDLYLTPASSMLSLALPQAPSPAADVSTLRLKPARSKSSIGSTSSNFLGLLPENSVAESEDWTQSVFASNLDWKVGGPSDNGR